MVSSYLSSYNYTALQYDNQMNEYQIKINDYDEQIKKAEEQDVDNETVDVEALKMQRDTLITSRESVNEEKTQALLNLELQQISTIEKQILGYNDSILSMETSLVSARLQLEGVNGVDNDTKESVMILTEKGNIAEEMLSYEEKVKECESYLKSYDIQMIIAP